MKLLLLSDKESPYLWDYYQPGRLSGYDLMLSCGDLNPKYLSFVLILILLVFVLVLVFILVVLVLIVLLVLLLVFGRQP